MNTQELLKECLFKAVRSSGSGGQHVNKVATKIELQFSIETSAVLRLEQKEKLKKALQYRLTKDHVLLLQCSESRSQYQNKRLVKIRFIALITAHLKSNKPRIPTKVPRAAIQKRLKKKHNQSLKKTNRRKPEVE
ncbi:MAG: aminoacyl-tRNA hydrolase [Flavobacteriaceae bacterium]|nr:aminoacyl-tRNA hydrolase [Flavobacteriaceae bacterium]